MRKSQEGMTLLEVLITFAILMIITSIAIPVFRAAMVKAEMNSMKADARTIYTSLKRYSVDHDGYPDAVHLVTLEPLRQMGYYRGSVVSRLDGGAFDAYDSPDDMGPNREFWLELTLEIDPTVRVLVADSNDAPLGGGDWYDGIYVWKNGQLQQM